jgi:hypothetical protein
MKQILKYSYFFAAVSMFFTLGACVKNRNDSATDFTQIKPIVEIRDNISGVGNDAGLAYFGKATLNFSGDPDTVSFYVNMASVNALDKDVTVTLGVDAAALAAYNADPNNSVKYDQFPDSVYSFAEKQVTIKAGERVALVSLQFFPSKIDPSKNYMLPISITDASGVDISGNFGTIYYHVIGNVLAGSYYQSWYRYNDLPDTTGPPNSTVSENVLKSIAPENATTLFLPEGYLDVNGLGGVSLYFTNNGGVLSDFSVGLNDVTTQNLADVGFTVVTAPKLIDYKIVGDLSTHYAGSYFRIYFEVLNSSGGNRKTINIFYKK